jgi:3-oxoacyl-[acyl-carrier-protein] synthase-3
VLSGDETLISLACLAAERALQSAGIRAGDVDYLICSNVLSEYVTPTVASQVQGALGLFCPSFDLNAGCAGFVYALQVASGLMHMGYPTVLIVSAEMNTRLCDWEDRSTCVLFGDGAAAAVVRAGDTEPIFEMHTKPNQEALHMRNGSGNSPYLTSVQPEYLHMNGQEVYRFAVSEGCKNINSVLRLAGLLLEDVAYYIMHQANLRIIRAIQERFALPDDRFPANIGRYGNTSSASIPILLDEMNREGRLKDGDKLVLNAFGAGLQTATCLFTWE